VLPFRASSPGMLRHRKVGNEHPLRKPRILPACADGASGTHGRQFPEQVERQYS
jgi:hypothetical protein